MSVGAIYTIATWPVQGLTLMSTDSTTAAVGLAVGIGAAWYLIGSPIPAIQAQDWMTVAMGYGVAGVGYYAGTMAVAKYNSSSQ